MSTEQSTRPAIANAYTRPATRETLLAEAFSCILNGRPFPDALRAPTVARPGPASCAEGLARTMGEPGLA